MGLKSLEDVYVDQIADLYSAEQQLVKALPKVADAASSSELRQAFEAHLKETEDHVQRLEKVREALSEVPDVTCKGMEGLIKEGDEIVSKEGDKAAKDAALIAAAQRVEHYEIAAYGTARALAEQLGRSEDGQLLDQTLSEESNADEKLTGIATAINAQAV
jgi:ferritin-like metal-binding protein YciE